MVWAQAPMRSQEERERLFRTAFEKEVPNDGQRDCDLGGLVEPERSSLNAMVTCVIECIEAICCGHRLDSG